MMFRTRLHLRTHGEIDSDSGENIHGVVPTPQERTLTWHEPPLIGTYLLQQKLISADQLDIALHEQKQRGLKLGETLVKLGFLDENAITFALATRAGLPTIDIKTNGPDPRLVALIPQEVAQRCLAVAIKQTGSTLTLAMADPLDIVAMDEVRRHLPRGFTIHACVARKEDILDIIGACGSQAITIETLLRELETGLFSAQKESDYEHPVIRLVDLILAEAVQAKASDIHFEPEESFIRIRYRIDGVLRQIRAIHLVHWPALSHRLKIIAEMNIADTRSIQDGRFQLEHSKRVIDCRVAIMPTVWGETIVVRILDHNTSLLPLCDLGYSKENEDHLRRIMSKPQGIVLLTGPTGSGKTTTLYSLLQALNTQDIHIATLEEPVEYQLQMIRQTSIQEAQGLDFSAGIRGLLRMDPDVILIGEVRDPDTAQMALRAAMTGHQVYSTLHCNDVFGAFPRLYDLGLNARTLAGNICGIVAQRLVRKLCPHCKRFYRATDHEAHLLGLNGNEHLPMLAFANGCEACAHTGRSGRTVIAEVLSITTELDDLVALQASRSTMLACVRANGFITMQEDGCRRVLSGEIALADLSRCVDMTQGLCASTKESL